MSVKGLADVRANLAALRRDAPTAMSLAISAEALEWLGLSRRRVPVATGRLRNSGYASPASPTNLKAQVGYATDYAVAVHERVEVFHAVGGPLYLKSVVDEREASYVERIRDRAAVYSKIFGVT